MIETNIKDIKLKFNTSPKLFSPQKIDAGTLAMLSQVSFTQQDKVLDLGCGYGVVGILAAKMISPDKVVMVDSDQTAVDAASENILLNDLTGIRVYKNNDLRELKEYDFTLILCNPPYHTDFSTAKMFIERGFNKLAVSGKMYLVTKRKTWYEKKLTAIFGNVTIREIDGYYVFMARKKDRSWAKTVK